MSKSTQIARWHIYPTAETLRKKAVAVICRAANESIARDDIFHLVLAGGTTPQAVYAMLRESPAEWSKWRIWFGDERCLPEDHPERNSKMARDAWLSHVSLSPSQIHAIPAELGAQAGAAAYVEQLKYATKFDLVLLGLGEDGHTASLFPGHDWGTDAASPTALAVHEAPKPPAQRISLSAARLSHAHQVIFLVTGKGKSEAVQRWRGAEPIPASAVCPPNGVDVLVEEAAFNPI